jgi:hypothetical protein
MSEDLRACVNASISDEKTRSLLREDSGERARSRLALAMAYTQPTLDEYIVKRW